MAEEYIDEPMIGYKEKRFTRLNQEASDKLHDEDARQLGFDPRKRDACIAFFSKEENRIGFQEAYGHLYKVFYCPHSHFASYFFVPFKNFDSACVRYGWAHEDGSPISSARLTNLAVKYCAGYREGQGTHFIYNERLVPVAGNVHRLTIESTDLDTGKTTAVL